LLFAALAIFTTAEHWKWTVIAVRLAVPPILVEHSIRFEGSTNTVRPK
jgi:hypothetical protein